MCLNTPSGISADFFRSAFRNVLGMSWKMSLGLTLGLYWRSMSLDMSSGMVCSRGYSRGWFWVCVGESLSVSTTFKGARCFFRYIVGTASLGMLLGLYMPAFGFVASIRFHMSIPPLHVARFLPACLYAACAVSISSGKTSHLKLYPIKGRCCNS